MKKGNQGASLPLNQSCDNQGASLLCSDLLKCWSKGFSTLIRVAEMSIKGLLYFDLNCWKVDQRASLLWSELVEMLIRGLLYFDLDCWIVDQRASLLRSELLKCRSQGFSTLIWVVESSIKGLLYLNLSYWNVNQRASQLRFKLLPAKSQNLGLDFKWRVLCGRTVFRMCDFHLFDLNFFNWFLKFETWDFERLKFWNSENWILKFQSWDFENL